MMKTAADVRDTGLRIFDLAVLGLAFPIAYAMYEHAHVAGRAWLPPIDTFWPVIVLVLVSWAACASIYQVYEAPLGRSPMHELARAARALGTVAVVIATLAFLTRDHAMPRLLFGLYFSFVLALLLAGRVTWRAVASAATRGKGARRYAVVGTGGMAREIVESIGAHPEWGMHFAGFVRLDAPSVRSREDVLGS